MVGVEATMPGDVLLTFPDLLEFPAPFMGLLAQVPRGMVLVVQWPAQGHGAPPILRMAAVSG